MKLLQILGLTCRHSKLSRVFNEQRHCLECGHQAPFTHYGPTKLPVPVVISVDDERKLLKFKRKVAMR